MDKLETVKHILDQLMIKGNSDLIESAFSTNYIAHAGDKTYNGHPFLKRYTKQVRTAIQNIKITKVELLSETENTITWQRSFSGTHQANLRGIPASNKKVKWYEIVVSRFEGNLIAEEWLASDLAAQLMFKQPRK